MILTKPDWRPDETDRKRNKTPNYFHFLRFFTRQPITPVRLAQKKRAGKSSPALFGFKSQRIDYLLTTNFCVRLMSLFSILT
jgi:hypothetical protein